MQLFQKAISENNLIIIYLSRALMIFGLDSEIRYTAATLFTLILGKDSLSSAELQEVIQLKIKNLVSAERISEAMDALYSVNIIQRHQCSMSIDWTFFHDYLKQAPRDRQGMIIL